MATQSRTDQGRVYEITGQPLLGAIDASNQTKGTERHIAVPITLRSPAGMTAKVRVRVNEIFDDRAAGRRTVFGISQSRFGPTGPVVLTLSYAKRPTGTLTIEMPRPLVI